MACREAIEQAIADNYRDNRLGPACVQQVLQQFDYGRIFYVLANTVRQKDHDGRISRDNKAWAQTVPVCEDKDGFGYDRNVYFVVDRCNPGLNVADFHIQNFLDTRPGIIQKDHQELIPHSDLRPGVRLCKKRFYCFFRHIIHFRKPVIFLDSDSCQPACNADIFRAAGCGIGNKCPDGRQPVVARSRSGVLLC
ncbi:DUF3849 domain-containing protein [Acutalibacter sp. JLR.KK004]|uniref:DUF3849 domain-containing protein n=1 Tax=Acutalibacter sp. JLR.KK004 TaxID=3112622 RepID=UPI002FF0925C